MENYYTTLGVDRNATAEEIKKAYRRLAHQYHPDKKGGDEEKFKEVNAAYQVLSDQQKRAQYDQYGQTFENTGGAGPYAGGFNVNMDDFADLGSIFDQFFGGGSRHRSAAEVRGRDVQIDLTIDFADSAAGTNKETIHRLYLTCERCHGNKAEPGTPINKCTQCNGRGYVSKTRSTMLGAFSQNSPCPACQGEGTIPSTPCTNCKGAGRELRERTLSIAVPAGIADGQTIRLSGKGEAPPVSGSPGDLYVTVHVRQHRALRREHDNIISTADVSFVDAALGTTLTIDTLSGRHSIDVPAGTQPGNVITLSGLGFPSLRQSARRGDHLVKINVTIPKKLSRHQKKLLQQYRQTKPRKTIFG